jgi:hypothetical protein
MALKPFVGPWPLFHFLNLYTVDRTPWTKDQPVARPRPTHRTVQTHNKRTQTSVPRVGFEPMTQCSSRRRQFRPWTARPLWSAAGAFTNFINNWINILAKSDISSPSSNSDKRALVTGDFGRVAGSLGCLKELSGIRHSGFEVLSPKIRCVILMGAN